MEERERWGGEGGKGGERERKMGRERENKCGCTKVCHVITDAYVRGQIVITCMSDVSVCGVCVFVCHFVHVHAREGGTVGVNGCLY